MNESKHTPGSWRFVRDMGSGCWNCGEINEEAFLIRNEVTGVAIVLYDDQAGGDDRAEGNAQIIAAVPDLLAALKEIIAQAESYCRSAGHKEAGAAMSGACDAICACIPPGRAAIAKAEGSL